MNLKYDWVYTAVSLVIIVAVVLLAISFAATHIFRLDPAEAMKSHLSAKADVRQPRYMKYIGYAQKVCILCGLRNKRRLVLSYVSTILTVTLIMFAFQYSDAGNYVSEHTYTERFLYDVQVLFDEALSEDEASEMMANAEAAERYELFSRASVQIESGDAQMDTTLYGISENSSMVHVYGAKREKLSMASDGIVLSLSAAEELNVSKGDTVLVNDIPLTVTGIHEENIFFVQYCNSQVFEEIAGNKFHGANVILKDGMQYHKLYDALKDQTGFGYISKKTSQQEGVDNRLEKSAIAVYVLIIMAFIAGFTIIYNMSVINFKERVRVFSVMMAIGTDIGKIAGATFLELLIQYTVSVIIGSLIGIYAGKILLYAASTNSIQYQTALSEVSLLWMAVCVAAFMLLGHMMALKNLKEMDIVEILKTRE